MDWRLSILSFVVMIVLKFGFGTNFSHPLPELTTLLAGLGVQSLLLGVLSELLMRTYFESQGRRPYEIRETLASTVRLVENGCDAPTVD